MKEDRSENIPVAILYILVAVFLFGIVNALAKLLAVRIEVFEILFFRNLFGLIPAVAIALRQGLKEVLKTERPGGHLWRAFLGQAHLFCLFTAFAMMPLADAISISFSSPLILVALSVPLLGERVGIQRWVAVVVGLCGMLLIVRPTGDAVNLGALFAAASAVLYALSVITIRQLSKTESSAAIAFYYAVFATIGMAVLLPLFWTTPTLWELFLLLLTGLAGGLGQYFTARAYGHSPAAALAPFNYTQLIWAVLFGLVLFGEFPKLMTFAGAAVITGSGLYVWQRERRLARLAANAAPGTDSSRPNPPPARP